MTTPSTDLILRTDPALPPSGEELQTYIRLANNLCVAEGFVPKAYLNKGPAVLACVLKGRELGLGPMTALSEIHVIDGRPTLSAALMLAKLRQGGVKVLESVSTRERAWIRAERSDTGEVAEVEWTLEEASAILYRTRDGLRALVEKDNWVNYGADMLWARCVGRLARRLGPDILMGISYSAEELRDSRGTIDGEAVEEEPAVQAPLAPVLVPEDDGKPATAAQEPPGDDATARDDTQPPPFDLGQYDALSAAEIKQKLPLLLQRENGPELLAYVRAHEEQGAKRSTILRLIEKLLAGEPVVIETEPEPEPATASDSGPSDEEEKGEPRAAGDEEPAAPPSAGADEVVAATELREAARGAEEAPAADELAEPALGGPEADEETPPRIRYLRPDGKTFELVPLEDDQRPVLARIEAAGFTFPAHAEGGPPMWSEPDQWGIRTIQLLHAVEPGGEESPERVRLESLFERSLAWMAEHHPEVEDWRFENLMRRAGESFRKDPEAIKELVDLSDSELVRLVAAIPDNVKQAVA